MDREVGKEKQPEEPEQEPDTEELELPHRWFLKLARIQLGENEEDPNEDYE